MESINVDALPFGGPYSHAVRDGDLVHCSGQVALDPATGALVDGDVTAQAERIFANLELVLAAAGCGLGDVLRTGVYLVDLDDFAALNEAFGRAFGDHRPARTTIGVAGLPLGARVEVDCVARKPAA
jgi:2-iminobutanoate/2-iminopropanoate deaminase